eukprot:s681_g4.t1
MADGSDLRIVIQKISGETLETTARSEDTVGDLKRRIVQEVHVPSLCQRLVLHSVPQKLIFLRSLPHFSKELEKPLGEMEPKMYAEVRALSRPPTACFTCIVMVLQLLAALGPSAFENLPAFARLGLEPWNDDFDWRQCTWKDCMMMTGPWNHFRQNLHRIATVLLDEGLDDAKVQVARSTLEDLGGAAAPAKMQKVSVLCYWLTLFVVEVVKRQQTSTDEWLGSVELRNGVPISVYCTEKSISEVWRSPGQQLGSISAEEFKTAAAVKRRLRDLYDFPVCLQQLLHNGNLLSDDAELIASMSLQLGLLTIAGHSGLAAAEMADAAALNRAILVRWLLEAGVDKDCRDHAGMTAVMVASANGHLEVVRVLLTAGAHKHCSERGNGKTALILASEGGHKDIVQLPVVRLLLRSGAKTNGRGRVGKTALMLASQSGRLELVVLFLRAHAAKNLTDLDGKTALMLASENGHFEVARLLLEAGAEKEPADRTGKTALVLASESGHLEVVRLLLEARATRNCADNDGMTALMFACRGSHVEIADLLLKAGADKECQGRVGKTVPMLAFESAHSEVACLLLEGLAAEDCAGEDGIAASILAIASGSSFLELALLADLEPAFRAIDGSAMTEVKLEAVRALGDLGGKCPEKSIPALCRCWSGWHTAEAAFRSLKLIASPGADALELFLASSPRFFSFEPDQEAQSKVWAGVVEGLVTGSRQACLETFKEMLPTASVSHAIQGLLKASFRTEFTAQSLDAVLREALVLLGEHDSGGLVEGFSGYLDPAQPTWVQARASAWVAEVVQGPEEGLAQVMLAALHHLHGQELVTVAKSLLRISPSSKPEALDALCKELFQATRGAGGRDMFLTEIESLTEADDPVVLKRLMDFVTRGEHLLKSDRDWSSLSAAMKVLDHLDQTSRTFFLEAYRRLTRTAARFCHYSADLNGLCAEAPRHLLQLARAHGGVEHEVLVELRNGFKSQNGRIRAGCFKTFAAIPKQDVHQANSLLLQVINSDEHSWSRQAAMRGFDLSPAALEVLGPGEAEEIKTSLLRAAEDPTLGLRAAALSALRPLSRDEEVRSAALKYFGDSDSSVKLEALGLMAELVPVPFSCLSRSFQCQDSDVVLLGLQAFAKSEEDVPADRQEELCTILRPLLMHRDEEIAVGAALGMGRLTSAGKSSAIAALEQRGIWPETRAAVLAAHQEALQALGSGSG